MGIESSWFPGQFESSDSDKDKEDKDSRQKKRANAAPASRFEQPHSLNLTSQNQGQIELRPPRPPLLESLIHGQQKDQEITKAGLNLPLPGEAVTHPMEQGQPPEAIPNPELNQSNEDEDEDEEEDEKPIAQAPQAEQARPATFEEIMSQ